MSAPELPMAADKIHVSSKETLSNLGVGQTGQYVYPISKCCQVRADRRSEKLWGSSDTIDSYFCCFCEDELEPYEKHAPEFVNILHGGAKGAEYILLIAVTNWTHIPQDELLIKVEE